MTTPGAERGADASVDLEAAAALGAAACPLKATANGGAFTARRACDRRVAPS